MDPLTIHPIQTSWKLTIKLYPSWWCGFLDDQDYQLGNHSVWTQIRTWSDFLEPSLTLPWSCLSYCYLWYSLHNLVIEQVALLKNISVLKMCLTTCLLSMGTGHYNDPNRYLCCMHQVDITAPGVLAYCNAFLLLLFIYIIFTLIGVLQKPIPLYLLVRWLHNNTLYPLCKNQNFTPSSVLSSHPRSLYYSPPPGI
jgi:hypothetical protein